MISQDFPPQHGGIPTYAHELARRWAPRHELTVVAPEMEDAAVFDREVPWTARRVKGMPDVVGFSSLPHVLIKGWDVVFCAQWSAAPAALAARRAGRVGRVAVAAHGRELLLAPWPLKAQRLYDALRKQVVQNADVLLPVSHYTAGLLAELGADAARVAVVSNGCDPERFTPGPSSIALEGSPVVLTVSRLVARKGIDSVLAAWGAVRAAFPEAVYVIVGGGPDRARLEALALEHAQSVRFVGAVDGSALRDWYNAADLFVMPARSEPPDVEGFGLVFLEAGACGKPVIGARAGGVVDAIDHEQTGLLVPPNDVGALAVAMQRILGDQALAEKLGRAGRARAEASTWDAVADRIERHLA